MILLGDLHFGVKKFKNDFFENQLTYIEYVFNRAREENDVIFQLGDIFDNRNVIDILMFNKVVDFFKKQCKNVPFFTLLGNHDLYFNNGNDTSLVSILDESINNFFLIDKIQYMKIQGKNILVVPYQENFKIPKFDVRGVDYIFGHFDIKGFRLIGTTLSQQGLEIDDFNHFQAKKVFSGHYHLKQEQNGILYVGTPYQLNWGDMNNTNGFHIIHSNGEISFEENRQSKRYVKITIGDKIVIESSNRITEYPLEQIDDLVESHKNDFVKIEYEKFDVNIQHLKDCFPEGIFQSIQIIKNVDIQNSNEMRSPVDVLLNCVSDEESIQIIKEISNEAITEIDFK